MLKKESDIFSFSRKLTKQKIGGFSRRQYEGEDFPAGLPASLPLGVRVNQLYLKNFIAIFIMAGLLITARVLYLQLYLGENLLQQAEGNRIKTERAVAPRGLVYDRHRNVLVANHPVFSLKIIPAELPLAKPARQAVVSRLGGLLAADSNFDKNSFDMTVGVLLQEDDVLEPVIVLSDRLDYDTALTIKLDKNLPGILLEQGIEREYLFGAIASNILGYISGIKAEEWPEKQKAGYYYGDQIGRSGLEAYYQDILRGSDELLKTEVNARGEEQKIVARQEVKPGDNLVLTLDIGLQEKLFEVLGRYASRSSGRGAAVALDPGSGEVLAMVSVPGFDANAFIKKDQEELISIFEDEKQPLFNRAVSGTYPPGSTFKPLVAAAALSENIITPATTFMSAGGLRINDWFYPDWLSGGHGRTNLNRAIAQSVNTYFYYIGGGFEEFTGLGVDLIVDYARRFGLGQTLGLDLPGEAAGFLPSRSWKEKNKNEPWYVGDTYHLSIGQGDILVTPLQLAAATGVFANGGKLYQPRLVSAVTNESGAVKELYPSAVTSNQVVETDVIEAVRRAYRETVLSGSAVSLQSLPVTSAGKTGTAEVGGSAEPHAWFAGWAPYERPEIVIAVLVENGVGGATSAMPVFSEVVDWYFTR